MDDVHFENKVGTLEGKCLDYPEDSGGTPGTLAGLSGNSSGYKCWIFLIFWSYPEDSGVTN